MSGVAFRKVFESVFLIPEIEQLLETCGVRERERKMNMAEFVVALALCGGNHRWGLQAHALDVYAEMGNERVSRAAFYKRFTPKLLALFGILAGRALEWVLAQPVHLPGILAGVTDWRVVDSMTVRLQKALAGVYPATDDGAALKIHREISLGRENLVAYKVTPAREHDGPHLVVDERRRGQGLIVDLGYASHQLLRDCETFGVRYVIRLKGNWKVWVDGRTTDEVRATWKDDDDLPEQFTDVDIRALKSKVIDIDVDIGEAMTRARLVAFDTRQGRLMFLTNLPRTTHTAQEVGLLYRLRWAIELDNKLCKTALNVDEIEAKTETSTMIVVHAAMLGSILANGFVHAEHTNRGWTGDRRAPITQPPLHPISVAESVARSSNRIGELMLRPPETMEPWDRIVGVLVHLAKDPNWRRKPSPMDVVKGRTWRLLNTHRYATNPENELLRLVSKRPKRASVHTT